MLVQPTRAEPRAEEKQGEEDGQPSHGSMVSHGSGETLPPAFGSDNSRPPRARPYPFRAAQIIPTPQTMRSTGQYRKRLPLK